MGTPLLRKAYDFETFRKEGIDLIEQISEHLEKTISGTSSQVISWTKPEEEYVFWKNYNKQAHSSEDFFRTVIARSIHTHHPKYIGHQVAPTVPVSALATLLSAQLNNGMAVYEMGAASTALERIVIEQFTAAFGFENGDGFLTSGGTLANLTGLLAARRAKSSTDVWNEGHGQKLAILVSEEAHYCVDRSARIMGLGEAGIIKVPANEKFEMRLDVLEASYRSAVENGFEVIAIVGSAPSTSTGVYDDLEGISAFAKAHNLWFHIDAAHGGAAIFSSKYKHLLKGAENADSIIIDGHKMMGTSAITTAVIFKESVASYATFEQKAQYLWEKNDDPDWFNLAKRTFECTKSMMSIRFYAIINAYGLKFFDDFVTTLYDAGRSFGKLIDQQKDFELALQPISNIVCFRYSKGKQENINEINQKIRNTLLEDGEYYIVATTLQGKYFLRTTFMHPFTSEKEMVGLLDKIRGVAGS
ncbi:aminotransferase class I/II-fold pyridoxal phosphate-dependent enzyme [Dokdonia sinensis]|uniref:Aminotransferase class I/II-fold pyridoxal phosphate-dependent enzyme n=1 Tax=Dokdonia sinensis TaxID=2479847 RepID=A0A3M0GGH7_9FLAO|nr:aminotransferase class I/II-fold pyridoxal phosphate-dependent enzyme [Dokdonia sinensis]RMB63388.1 aminotransferase class I/II-fold pyridoxal phosphate-dependent enzyme [Dokdonia sinensis]